MIVLTVTLRSATRLRRHRSYDVTHPHPWDDGPEGPSATARTFHGQRNAGEYVLIAVHAGGMPAGSWRFNDAEGWPYGTAAAITKARRKEPVPQ